MSIGRNDPCPCGSGKKYKKCCAAKDEATQSAELAARAAARAATGEGQKPAQRKGFKGSGTPGGEGAAPSRSALPKKANLPRRGAV